MDLDPETNPYLKSLKELMDLLWDDNLIYGDIGYERFLARLGITPKEKEVLEKYFVQPVKLGFGQITPGEGPFLESLVFKYARDCLEQRAKSSRMSRDVQILEKELSKRGILFRREDQE